MQIMYYTIAAILQLRKIVKCNVQTKRDPQNPRKRDAT